MTSVDQYQTRTEALAATTTNQALAVYAAYQAGRLTRDQAEVLIAAVVNQSNAAAVSLADAGLSVQIEHATGLPAPATGIAPTDDAERLEKAVHTILTEPEPTPQATVPRSGRSAQTGRSADNPVVADLPQLEPEQTGADLPPSEAEQHDRAEMRITRLARSEPLEAAQNATIDAMQQQALVEGWTRHMDADPCQLCRWWWREGRIWPKEHPFRSHKGCNCQPKVVLAEHIQSTVFTRRLDRERRAARPA